MDTSKIKNFIIIVLVLTNALLLVTYAVERVKGNEVKQAATQELIDLYEASGITLPDNLDIYGTAPNSCDLNRNLETERQMIEAILGKCSVSEQGGNIYAYTGENGQASFRGTGEFEMLLNYGVADSSHGRVEASKSVLKQIGMTPGSFSEETQDGEQYTVTLDCLYEGSEVYNARVNFLFSGDSLMIVSGKRVFDTKTDQASDEEAIDVGTALVRFLKESASKGYVCTAVTEISPGYAMSVTVSGDCILNPVWRIETDTGEYMLNAVTGRFETIAY
ncbi:MAG: hypothetical protein AB7D36_10500 [Oscillospiraceae bacterium]